MENFYSFLSSLTTAAVAILCLFLGKKLNQNNEIETEIRQKKAALYSQYLRIQCELYFDSNSQKQKYDKEYLQICDELCIYGGKSVLEKLSCMHKKEEINPQYYSSEEGKNDYAELVTTMRGDIDNKKNKICDALIRSVMGEEKQSI
jgi:hypothetical protein